jgi:hypothetical protein
MLIALHHLGKGAPEERSVHVDYLTLLTERTNFGCGFCARDTENTEVAQRIVF